MSQKENLSYLDFLNLDKELSDEQRLIRDNVRTFLEEKAEPFIVDHYRKEAFPEALIKEIGSLGILGANLTGYGLPGMDAKSYGLVMSELERVDSGLRSFASVQGALVMYPIWAFGSEEQKKTWLQKFFTGEAVGCFALTESEGGSDPSAMKTKAVKKGSKWILNGSKMWITNGNLADIAIVWAQTDEGVRGFLVETGLKGFSVKKMEGKLSLRASVTSELYFDSVELSEEALLPKSKGLSSALACLTQARYGIVWGVLGAAESCFQEVCTYVNDRVLFGSALGSKQLIQRKLAIMLSRISQGKLLANRLAELKDQGSLHFAQVSLGKQNNCEMALQIARECRDILGGNGIMDEYKTMRHMCNLETVFTYEGTNDIHLLIVGSHITGKASF